MEGRSSCAVLLVVTLTVVSYVTCAAIPYRRALLQSADVVANLQSNSTWVAHQCLWSTPALADPAAATATATATATAVATASATATATATASASAVSGSFVTGGTCSLNPSYFFSLAAQGRGPAEDSERLLLQITAMRYVCLNHTTEAICSEDQVARVVQCSFGVSSQQCIKTAGCEWSEGACYPSWYSPMITKPKLLAKFKHQVQVADPEVWGTCVGADMYRTYSSICNHQTQDACKQDPAGCTYLTEYETEVTSNPLNFSKPCILSSARFPLESVFLGSTSSPFAAAVLEAQRGCTSSGNEPSCTANTTALSSNVLEAAMTYSASTVFSNKTSHRNTSSSSNTTGVGAGSNAGPQFAAASWSLQGVRQGQQQLSGLPRQRASTFQPTSSAQSTGNTGPAFGVEMLAAGGSPSAPAKPPVPQSFTSSTGVSMASASASATTMAVGASSTAADSANLKNRQSWLKPVQTAESWLQSGLFGASEFPSMPGMPTLPGTWKAATVSLRVLHIVPAPGRWSLCSTSSVQPPFCTQQSVLDSLQVALPARHDV